MSDGNGVIDTVDDDEPLHSGPCAVDDWCARCEERTVEENTDPLGWPAEAVASVKRDWREIAALTYIPAWRFKGRAYDPQRKRGGR